MFRTHSPPVWKPLCMAPEHDATSRGVCHAPPGPGPRRKFAMSAAALASASSNQDGLCTEKSRKARNGRLLCCPIGVVCRFRQPESCHLRQGRTWGRPVSLRPKRSIKKAVAVGHRRLKPILLLLHRTATAQNHDHQRAANCRQDQRGWFGDHSDGQRSEFRRGDGPRREN